MNKRDYYTPDKTELPHGYVVIRKCSNCRAQNCGCCTYKSRKPDITVTREGFQAWEDERTVDPDGRCDHHVYRGVG